MKKILLSSLLLITVLLVGCGDKSKTVDVNITNKSHDSLLTIYSYDVLIEKNITNESDLNEIVNDTTRQIYDSISAEIGFQKYQLEINFSMLENSSEISLGKIIFLINKDDTNPGLSLEENLIQLP